MDENGFRPEDITEKVETAEKKAEGLVSEALDNIEEAAGSAEHAAEDAILSAEEKFDSVKESADEIYDGIREKAEDVKAEFSADFEKASEMLDDAEEKAAEKLDVITEEIRNAEESAEEKIAELKEDIAESSEEFAEEVKDAFEEEKEAFLEETAELKDKVEDTADGLFAEIPEKAAEIKNDFVEAVSYKVPDDPVDELQDFRTINSHKPSIPQYVPKTYSRDISEEPDTAGIRGAVNVPYEGFPPVDDVEPAPKGVLNADPEGKSSKTVLWIVLAILVCLIIAGCCLAQAFFGILNLIAG